MEGIIYKHKERNSSFELLRILCMLFVVGGHLIGKGMQITYDDTLLGGGDYGLSRLLYSFCTVAVSTFILISGYFGIKFNWRKIVKIWFSVLFFAWMIAGYKIIKQNDFKGSLPYFLPIISNEFWFISCYFVLCGYLLYLFLYDKNKYLLLM
ncbi:MAG: acyltransferase family protein [Segatella oris]|uniref:acyltransferase family protein n=1 Tax=Segatella oris TaxID=28135 RepID=UPI003FA2AAAD